MVVKNGLFGVIDMDGHAIIPCDYEAIDIDIPFFIFENEKYENKIITLKNGIYQYFDSNGKLINKNVSPQIFQKENEMFYKLSNDSVTKRALFSNEYNDYHMKLVK